MPKKNCLALFVLFPAWGKMLNKTTLIAWTTACTRELDVTGLFVHHLEAPSWAYWWSLLKYKSRCVQCDVTNDHNSLFETRNFATCWSLEIKKGGRKKTKQQKTHTYWDLLQSLCWDYWRLQKGRRYLTGLFWRGQEGPLVWESHTRKHPPHWPPLCPAEQLNAEDGLGGKKK